MKTPVNTPFSLLFGLVISLAFALPHREAAAAESIKGTYVFEGKARAAGANGPTTKKFKGKMRVGLKSVTLQIPISKDGKVVTCQKMIRAQFTRKLKRNPARANRRAKFMNAKCGDSKWIGTLRLRWIEHPEGYALAFSIGGVNVDVAQDKITGRFKGSTGTLSTEENTPVPPDPVPPVVE